MKHPAKLSIQTRAELFSQLAAMEKAGLPFDRALDLLKLPAAVQARVAHMRRLSAAGLDTASAGLHSGVFNDWEAGLLHAALQAGSPERMYRRLSEHYSRRSLQLKQIKSRLMLPAATLILFVVVSPLPSLVAGDLGAGQYLWHCTRTLLLLAAVAWLVVEPPAWLSSACSAATQTALDRTIARIPLIGKIYIRRSARDFFESLALLIEAGMPMLQALPQAVRTIQNLAVRAEFARLQALVESGKTLTLALRALDFPGRDRACSMAATGEASGALPDMLLRYANSEAEAIRNFDEQLSEWAPRIVYMAVALRIAYSLIQGVAFMPSLPAELR